MMKRFFVCTVLYFVSCFITVQAQFKESKDRQTSAPCTEEIVRAPQRKARIFWEDELYEEALNKKMKLPRSLRDKITFSFIVRCDSLAYKFKILRGINAELDPYILQAVQKVQAWRPALQDKSPVNSRVTFTLEAYKGKLRLPKD